MPGAKTCRLNVPANAPAKDLWSVVLYDLQTRSELQTTQPFRSKNNKRARMAVNADGSVDLYFGPQGARRQGGELDCVRPGKDWLAISHLYCPLEPQFDRNWRAHEIEEVK